MRAFAWTAQPRSRSLQRCLPGEVEDWLIATRVVNAGSAAVGGILKTSFDGSGCTGVASVGQSNHAAVADKQDGRMRVGGV